MSRLRPFNPGVVPLLLLCLLLIVPIRGFAAPPADESSDELADELEAPPNAGEPPPNAGEPPPDSGEAPPNAGEPPPNAGGAPPNAGEPPPDSGEAPPDSGEAATDEADTSADSPAPTAEDPPTTEEPPPTKEPPPTEPPPPRFETDAADDAAILPGSDCDLRNRADPLYPVVQALSLMRTGKLELVDCQQLVGPGQGPRMIEARIRGADQDLLLYRLERLAADGFEVFLAPLATHEVLMAARPAVIGGSVLYVDVNKLSLHGTFVEGDDRNRIARVIGLRDGNFYPFEYAERLREIGYRAEFYPVAAGEVVIEVRPGRSIRRVRIRGHIPLAKRDILRQLSVDAQPGALARGQCVEKKRLRESTPPPICDARDVACLEWERDEIARLDEFLWDSGYFDGSSRLALVCGRSSDEADLYVYLDKGKPYKVDRRRVEIVDVDGQRTASTDPSAAGDNAGDPLEDRDVRWIRRQFIPKVLGVFRTRVTAEFMDKATDKVTRAYAEPGAGLGRFWRSDATLPHPEVEVESSYEELDRESKPDSHNIPLEVRVARGPGVQTEFRPAPGTKPRRSRESGLSFSNGQLRSQIQLFNRREPATAAAAQRESANIRAFYQSKGYLFARVEGKHFDFKSMDKLRFEIAEGPKVEIAALEINRPARLDEAVAKRIERAWDDERKLRKGGKFSESDALADIQSIIAAYNAEGYLCTTVVIYLGFWPEALADPGDDESLPEDERPRVRAALTVKDLLDSGGSAAWLGQFDPAGLAGVLDADRADIYVRIAVDPGPRVVTTTTEQLRFLEEPIAFSRKIGDPLLRESADPELAAEVVQRSPLHRKIDGRRGQVPISPSLDRDARASIVSQYRNAGFPVSDAELTWQYTSPGGQVLVADAARNLPDARYGICTNRKFDKQVEVEPIVNVYEGRAGEFGDILFRGNFKTRDWVLRRELKFKTGQAYDQSLVDASAASIEASGVAKSVTITPYPVGCNFAEDGPCYVHQVVVFEEAKDVSMTIDFGFGAATLNPFYVFANPTFPNMFGTGWDLSLEGRWGFDLSNVLDDTEVCAGQQCYERLAAATLSRPHIFASEFDLDISSRIQQRATPARGEIVSVVVSPRISRRFREWTFYAGYLFQFANVSKDLVKPLAGADVWVNRTGGIVSDRTGLFDTGVVLTRVDNAFNPHDGFIATMDLKLASPWFGGQDWWARFDIAWQQFIPLPIPGLQERLNFRYSLRYGHLLPFHGPGFSGQTVATDTVPDVWRYYGGGTADLGIRGILPETMLVDIEEIELPYGGVIYRPRAQGGHIRAIGTVALQVTSVKNLFGGALAHSIFYDFGVLTQFWDKFNFRRDFRHSIGTNFLKLDIGIVTMALGYAILIPGQYNVGPTDDRNGRFIFDVGVTF